jgi:hypothetical protein
MGRRQSEKYRCFMSSFLARRLAVLIIAITVTACDALTGLSDLGNDLDDMFGTPLLGIGIGFDQGQVVEVGDTIRVTATGDLGGVLGIFMYDRLLDARWSVSDATIAQIQPLPPPPRDDSTSPTRTLIRGLRPGSTQVMATARGISGAGPVRVIPVLNTIRLTPTRDTLVVGDTISMTAAAFDATGAPVNGLRFTFAVGGGLQLYSWSDTTARVVAVAAGPATVIAHFRRTTGEAALVVNPRVP